MTERIIYARAYPEKVRLTERYYYQQEISRNSALRMSQEAEGKIEIIVPYDGSQYFTRQACDDVMLQQDGAWPTEQVYAQIGHMLLAEYGRTDLGELLNLDDRWGSVPLRVPVADTVITNEADLCDDQHSCQITYLYKPNQPDINPLYISMELLDEKFPDRPDHDQFTDDEIDYLREWIIQMVGQVNLRRSLHVVVIVELMLPRNRAPADDQRPLMKRMALSWPTITSLLSLRLQIDKQPHSVMYNPEQRRVEWTNVPMRPVDILPGTDLQVYRSPPMYLFIEQPGEFYQQVSLDGQVEVEIPGTLLSGLNVHMYNGAGRTQKNLQPNLTTSVINDLVFVLDEAFAQRPLALYQRLHFDEVIPDDLRIADIRATLTDRGFQIVRDSLLHRSYDVLHHFLWGECPEGSNTLRLWLFIMGRRYPAERQARMRGGMMFTRAIEGGEIEIYMRGELVGNSQRLTQQMNMVQVALRDRFAHLRAKR